MVRELTPNQVKLPPFVSWSVGQSRVWAGSKRKPRRHIMLLSDFTQGHLYTRFKGDPLCTTYVYSLKEVKDSDVKINCPQCISVLEQKGWIREVEKSC